MRSCPCKSLLEYSMNILASRDFCKNKRLGFFLEQLYLFFHHKIFNQRLKKQRRFADKHVISVGNLSTGGVGKTPLCASLAQYLKTQKRRSLIVSRGYRAQLSRKGVLVSDGKGKGSIYDVSQVGDESLLLSGLKDIKVAIGRDRSQLIQDHAKDVQAVILDDAFQNPSIYRDHDLVLIDATIGPTDKKTRLFPYGRMREPIDALKRANTVLLTRCDQVHSQQLSDLRETILKFCPSQAVFESSHKVVGLRPVLLKGRSKKEAIMPNFKSVRIQGEVGAFCGLGNPKAFFSSVKEMGYELQEKRIFPDHHNFRLGDIKSLSNSGIRNWVTSAKDNIRIERHPKPALKQLMINKGLRLFVLEVTIEILKGRENEFFRRVCARTEYP